MEQNLLPVWIDDDEEVHYKLSDELDDLTDAEKMLIQRASPFILLYHIEHGTFRIKGHVCMFQQDITKVCSILPRLSEDINNVRVIHKYEKILEEKFKQRHCLYGR